MVVNIEVGKDRKVVKLIKTVKDREVAKDWDVVKLGSGQGLGGG